MAAGAGVAIAGMAGVVGRRRLVAAALGLPVPRFRVVVERGVRVAAGDGVGLATDVYHPAGLEVGPAVLMRTPYGRRGVTGVPTIVLARLLAERGFRVVAQDVRGRFDSGGDFTPFVRETADGAATAAWVVAQPWSDGRVGAWGPSYVGAAAWAAGRAPEVSALVVQSTSTRLGIPDRGGLRHLDTTVRWLASLDAMEASGEPWWVRGRRLAILRGTDGDLEAALQHLPLSGLAEAALGHTSPPWDAWVAHPDADAPYWRDADHRVARTQVAAAHVTGWWDLFVDEQLEDFAAAPPGTATLTVGPWHHLDLHVMLAGLREGLAWLDHHLRDGPPPDRAPVRVFVGGGAGWCDLDAWPPPATPSHWRADACGHLHPAGPVTPSPPPTFWHQRTEMTASARTLTGVGCPGAGSEAGRTFGDGAGRTFRYDPAEPTPALGGRLLSLAAGSVDNAVLEARSDVLAWTSEPLPAPLEVIGRPSLWLPVSADRPSFDLFARLCDVDRAGVSRVITDGIVRVQSAPAGGGRARDVEVLLSATGHRFQPGHRLRLVVCGGAFPRYDRNHGDSDPHALPPPYAAVEVTVGSPDADPLLTVPQV